MPVELMRMAVQTPYTSVLQIGAVAALEPDYKQQLGIPTERGDTS